MFNFKIISYFIYSIIFCLGLTNCHGQKTNPPQNTRVENNIVGGGCDGCELMFEGMPHNIAVSDTSIAWAKASKKFIIKGSVYKRDDKTPASGIIIYYWHTDSTGRYSSGAEMTNKAKRHGSIRGWVKTDKEGKYFIYTSPPIAYPNSDIPAHVHFAVKEPYLNEYFIDELVFDDDPLLTADKRKKPENRGGSGIVKTTWSNSVLSAEHHIVLGLNIPDYPEQQ